MLRSFLVPTAGVKSIIISARMHGTAYLNVVALGMYLQAVTVIAHHSVEVLRDICVRYATPNVIPKEIVNAIKRT